VQIAPHWPDVYLIPVDDLEVVNEYLDDCLKWCNEDIEHQFSQLEDWTLA